MFGATDGRPSVVYVVSETNAKLCVADTVTVIIYVVSIIKYILHLFLIIKKWREINLKIKNFFILMSEIEHLILSGGGVAGIIEYGIIKHLIDKKKIDMENIKSMYGTSIGSWLAVCFSLK